MRRFSAKKFKKHADMSVKRLLPDSHLVVLDGMEVVPDGEFGKIPFYQVDDEYYFLYPVLSEWCTSCEQTRMIL